MDRTYPSLVIVYPYQMFNFWHQIAVYAMDRVTPDNTIMRDVVLHTPRPVFLQNAIDEFLQNLGANFLAIHWRYDANDWIREQCSNRTPGKSFICQNPDIMTDVEMLASYIVKYLKAEDNFDFMYVSSPPAQLELLENVRKRVIEEIPMFQIYLQSDVRV